MNPVRKGLLVLLVGFLLGLLAGCTTAGTGDDRGIIQRVLDRALPANFKGDAHVEHKNLYFNFTVDAGGLRRGENGWEWDWLEYRRNGYVSNGNIIYGERPKGPRKSE